MEKKYIIKLEENEIAYKTVNSNGCPMIGLLHPAPYIEPDLEQVRKEAYEKGLSDAWEVVKKLARMDTDTSESITGYFGLHNIMHNLTASEAIEEIRAYEQAQKEKEEQIQVGDEVATDAGNRASVLYENPDGTQVFVFKSDGTAAWWTKSALHRTGRNFPEIDTVLEKMREESNG